MKEEVAELLLKIKAVSLSINRPYRFASGILSPIYCDNRQLMSYPEEREIILDYFLEIIKKINFDIIAGTESAGIPWAAWISQRLEKPMIFVRKKTKEHGKQNLIEGRLKEGKKVLVIEDLISTGGSSIAAINAIRDAGGIVDYCVAIFEYNFEEALTNFEKVECKYITLSDFKTLVKVAIEEDYINEKDKGLVLSWSKDPHNWRK